MIDSYTSRGREYSFQNGYLIPELFIRILLRYNPQLIIIFAKKKRKMSIEKLFETGERRQDRSHLRNMVAIAKADGVITDEERELLYEIGRKISLSDEQIKSIINSPEDLAITPPVSGDERFEQIVELIQMVQVDGKIDEKETNLLEKVAVGIGYKDLDEVDVESILALIIRGEDTDTIIEELG